MTAALIERQWPWVIFFPLFQISVVFSNQMYDKSSWIAIKQSNQEKSNYNIKLVDWCRKSIVSVLDLSSFDKTKDEEFDWYDSEVLIKRRNEKWKFVYTSTSYFFFNSQDLERYSLNKCGGYTFEKSYFSPPWDVWIELQLEFSWPNFLYWSTIILHCVIMS